MKSPSMKLGLSLAFASILTACANHHAQIHEHYAPGLGEIMAQTAVRHAKLWFAGQAKNWELAAYEVDELHEGFEDAAKFHPTHKHIQQPVPALIAQHMGKPLKGLEQAVKDRDSQAFTEHFDTLTEGCNACHQVTEFGFNRVTRPTNNPFTNQAFGTN